MDEQELKQPIETENDTTPEEQNQAPKKKVKKELDRDTIDCMKKAVRELIDPFEEKINMLLVTKVKQEQQEIEIEKIKSTQSDLYQKCMKIEHDNRKFKRRVEKLEEKMLESNLIMHGVCEDAWKEPESRREKLYKMISHTIDQDDPDDRMSTARSIPIRSSTHLGRYREGRNWPISICFEKKNHADVLMESKGWLP